MRHAESHETLNAGQYQSCSGREATRKALLNLDNDASSCYGHIIVTLFSLINCKYGQHRQIVLVNASTLKQAKYKLKIELGVSENVYLNRVHCSHSMALTKAAETPQ
jgi:hypothetical protein